jgi:T5orf172 domain
MPGHPFAMREASQPLSEPAKVIHFHDLLPDEPFHHCVHFTEKSKSKSKSKRCGKILNSRDRSAARALFAEIQSSSVNDLTLRDSLLRLAKITLCNHVHRPTEGLEGLYIRIVNRWNKDFEKETAAHRHCPPEKIVAEVAQKEADPIFHSPAVLTDHYHFPEDDTKPYDSDSIALYSPDEKKLRFEASKYGGGSSFNQASVLVSEEEIGRSDTESSPHVSSRRHSKPQGNPALLPAILSERVTRSGTITRFNMDYLPLFPELLDLSPSQLIHRTNQNLLSQISKPLTKTATKCGYVYIFTRRDEPTLVKIGYTKNSPEGRVAAWGRNCCFDAHSEFVTELTPHAFLIERLAQLEFAHCRMQEQQCKWKAMCPTKHSEWYRISVQEARRVIERWASWISKHQPWGPDHILRPKWRDALDKCRIDLKEPSSDKDMWEQFVKMVEPETVVPAVRSLSPPEEQLEQHQPVSTQSPTTRPNHTSPSPPTVHALTTKPSHTPPPPRPQTPPPRSLIRSSSPSSPPPSPFQTSSSPIPQPLSRRSTRYNFQSPPATLRAVLKSAFLDLDGYLHAASSGRKPKGTRSRISIRVDRKSLDVAWGELDEGYCTA